MARKPALKRSASSAGAAAPTAGAPPATEGRQVHTATFQPVRNASCNPVEVGPGYASEPFSVGRFKAECQDVLQQLSAAIGAIGDLAVVNINVVALRLPSLEEEVAAERAEAAAAAAAAVDAAVAASVAPGERAPAAAEAATGVPPAAAEKSDAAGAGESLAAADTAATAPLRQPFPKAASPGRHTGGSPAAAQNDAGTAPTSAAAPQAVGCAAKDAGGAHAAAPEAAAAAKQQAAKGGKQQRGAKRKQPPASEEVRLRQSPRRSMRDTRGTERVTQTPAPAEVPQGGGQPDSLAAAQPPQGAVQPDGAAAADAPETTAAAAASEEAAAAGQVAAEALQGHAAVKRRVRVLRAADGVWRTGTVASYNKGSGQHTVRFDDTFFNKAGGRRITERLTLADEKVELLAEERDEQAEEQPTGVQPTGGRKPRKQPGEEQPAKRAAERSVAAVTEGRPAVAAAAADAQPAPQAEPAAGGGMAAGESMQPQQTELGLAGGRAAAARPSASANDAMPKASAQGEPPQEKAPKQGSGSQPFVKVDSGAELALIERVKARRQQRMDAAVQALGSLQAEQQRAGGQKPRRDTNYAPPVAATDATAGAADGPAAADTAAEGANRDAAADAAVAADAAASTDNGRGGDAAPAAGGRKVDAGEAVLTVALSHPANAQRVLQQWRVLGEQPLSALRDRLYCRSDLDLRANRLDVPSGTFYVEGAFYNDMRDTRAIDYSYPIRAFCHTHGLRPPPRPAAEPTPGFPAAAGSGGGLAAAAEAAEGYSCADMAGTTFEELWLRVGAGAGYVYCHQGCCEHQLAFTDVRLLHPDDPQTANAYPQLVFQKHSRKRRCQLCERAPAVKITYDDVHAPTNPAFWCLDCFNKMHYDEERRLISSDFKQFDYIHD